MLENKIKSTPKKKLSICSPVFCIFFHSPQPNNIGPARQQPMDWGSLLISLSLVGEGAHSYYLLALRLLDYFGFCNGSVVGMEDVGGGGTHSSSTSLGLGISAPPPQHTPIFRVFVWGWEGAQKCFILGDQTTGDLKSHRLQARVTLTALSVPPGPHFLSAELQCHISNLFQLCSTVYTRNVT